LDADNKEELGNLTLKKQDYLIQGDFSGGSTICDFLTVPETRSAENLSFPGNNANTKENGTPRAMSTEGRLTKPKSRKILAQGRL